ncbi:hypothetical protein CgunFtcFv8_025291 [Champsocephalus gunnari]|uniref:Uncharacterized protein n=1 Tax=Champsocephalus gunnari TaxID=52237 RepID=A0AAN8CAG4_CHAGU|nr:hypothetical protein CgunFtcFv8_025291 [Champsocephalus gunnari]
MSSVHVLCPCPLSGFTGCCDSSDGTSVWAEDALQSTLKRDSRSFNLRAEDESVLRAEDESVLRAEDESVLRAEDESVLRAEDESVLRAEDESVLRAEDESVLRAAAPTSLESPEQRRSSMETTCTQ